MSTRMKAYMQACGWTFGLQVTDPFAGVNMCVPAHIDRLLQQRHQQILKVNTGELDKKCLVFGEHAKYGVKLIKQPITMSSWFLSYKKNQKNISLQTDICSIPLYCWNNTSLAVIQDFNIKAETLESLFKIINKWGSFYYFFVKSKYSVSKSSCRKKEKNSKRRTSMRK